MNRLTDDKTAQALKEIIDKLEAGGFEVDMSNRRYVRLAEYERSGFEPEEISRTADVEPVRHGRWVMREKDKLIPTGEIAVSEGHILHKTSFDKPFTLQSANIIQIKEHRTVKIPYCSICDNYGDDEYDKTPYCPYCGAKMEVIK